MLPPHLSGWQRPSLGSPGPGPWGARAPRRAGASGSITRASSHHPCRPPLGAQLKTRRLPCARHDAHGPASGLKAGAQPNAHQEHVWLQVNGPCIPTGPCKYAAPRGKRHPASGATWRTLRAGVVLGEPGAPGSLIGEQGPLEAGGGRCRLTPELQKAQPRPTATAAQGRPSLDVRHRDCRGMRLCRCSLRSLSARPPRGRLCRDGGGLADERDGQKHRQVKRRAWRECEHQAVRRLRSRSRGHGREEPAGI